ncbi:hypothetical protein EUX98_g9376, partial [Antrodiella citrinella]
SDTAYIGLALGSGATRVGAAATLPVPAITTGAHFYSIDTMHMVEALLRYDIATKGKDTNHTHPSAKLALHAMMNGLKDNPRNVYSKKSLAALCRLVIHMDSYYQNKDVVDPDLVVKRKKTKVQKGKSRAAIMMNDVSTAIANAEALLKYLDMPQATCDWDEVLGDGFYDPGEDIDISDFRPQL